ncbi:hypothetical protein [Paraburkholderia sp. BCC1884]|uniref:hypothetical protein n=1 Tax=Paraburkholderia sp. BCC1884 TaxID=2562668 RepID=UPI001182EFEB|nr:hypothetical protein [Paraburkholderia sp. BCC1884]
MGVQTRCPYSTDVLDGSEPENAEHILPVAFGAPDNFTVPAKAAKNTEMNDLIDEPANHDPIMRLIASAQGVHSRSGVVKVDLAGTAVETVANVRVTLGKGRATFKLRNPVDRDPVTGEIRGLMGFGDDAQKLLEQCQRDYAKKGKMIVADDAIPRHSDLNLRVDVENAEKRPPAVQQAGIAIACLAGKPHNQRPSRFEWQACRYLMFWWTKMKLFGTRSGGYI